MKILLIDVVCKNGSTGKIVYDLYSSIKASGNEAAVCYGRGQDIKEDNIFKFGIDVETYVHAFLTRITGYTGCFSYFSTKRLIEYIDNYCPDVVHLHELHAYFLNIKMLLEYLKSKNIKVIHTLHCAFSYTGKCGHHLDCEKWKANCGGCPRIKEYVSSYLFDHTKHMIKQKRKAFAGFNNMTIVCPSEWLASYARQSLLGQYPVKVIHNGIDVEVFSPKNRDAIRHEHNIKENEKVILAVAPNLMSKAKGGHWIIKLSEEFKEDNVRFIMVGVDSTTSNNPKIEMVKRTANQKMLADYYSMADAFVICSEMENFPTTCLESQCCGTPVFGFDVGGTKETDISGKDNFVKYGDIKALAMKIRYYFNGKEIDRDMLSNKAQALYSKAKMLKDYMALYKD